MERKTDKYREFVEHPRYGKRPKITGLNPSPKDANVHLHANAISGSEIAELYAAILDQRWSFVSPSLLKRKSNRIPNTAILADLQKQTPATVPVTHYFDLEYRCRDCCRSFIFFAEEQKYWYEELGFGLDSKCVRCIECRKKEQGIAQLRKTYESLFYIHPRTEEQTIELATCCLELIEKNIFHPRKKEFVRMLLNSLAADSKFRTKRDFNELLHRSKIEP